jgi:hypothetical protein
MIQLNSNNFFVTKEFFTQIYLGDKNTQVVVWLGEINSKNINYSTVWGICIGKNCLEKNPAKQHISYPATAKCQDKRHFASLYPIGRL